MLHLRIRLRSLLSSLNITGSFRHSISFFTHGMVLECPSTIACGSCRILLSLWLLLAHWKSSLVWIVEKLAFEVLLLLRGACTKGKSEELVCTSCFHVLLIQKIKQKIFIPLDQSLGVNLSMLKLLVSISLDSFKESS